MVRENYYFNVSLKIIGNEIVPDTISNATKITPDKEFMKGDPNPRGERFLPYQHNGWIVASKVPKSSPLDEHIMSIMNLVLPSANYIRQISQVEGNEVSFVITMSGVFKFDLRRDVVELVAQIGANIFMTVV